MIECNRCHCELTGKLMECVEVNVISQDLTEIDEKAWVGRYCCRCWDEMILYLDENGMM